MEISLSLIVKGNSFLAHKRSFITALPIIAWPPPLEKQHALMAKERDAEASVTTVVVPRETAS